MTLDPKLGVPRARLGLSIVAWEEFVAFAESLAVLFGACLVRMCLGTKAEPGHSTSYLPLPAVRSHLGLPMVQREPMGLSNYACSDYRL